MNDQLDHLKMFARFPWALRRFLRRSITLDEARRIVRARHERRDEQFLRMIERSIFAHRTSPYLALLRLAGCELDDLRALVGRQGLDGALRTLSEAGVYVTFEEFKGRRPIVRHGRTIPVTPRDFDNPVARRDFTLQTGGSSGLAASVSQDLDHIAAGVPHQLLTLDAWHVLNVPTLHWMPFLPGGGLRFILQRAGFGQYSEAWFSHIGWRDSKYWLKYGVASLYMIGWMRLLGIPVSPPRIVRLADAAVVARWMRRRLATEGRCLLYTNVSRALRVALAAEQERLDLTGATMRVGGEPITAAKVRAMQAVGVRVLPGYGAIDTGAIGLGCARSAEADDVHLVTDAFAIITQPHRVDSTGTTVPAFCLTSLLDTSPKVMLNYQSDDYGVLEQRSCGCALDAAGYTTHLHGIRSYSKLVGEGVTLIGNEMLEILERHLPTQFGGSPLDYQLMEEEDESGLTRLSLVISPRVGPVDESRAIDVILRALGRSSPMGDAARTVWHQAGTLRVKREEPAWTARGKLLPLHIRRREE